MQISFFLKEKSVFIIFYILIYSVLFLYLFFNAHLNFCYKFLKMEVDSYLIFSLKITIDLKIKKHLTVLKFREFL